MTTKKENLDMFLLTNKQKMKDEKKNKLTDYFFE